MVKIIECPRDAMQGLENFIPTNVKVNYINQLLRVGFDTIDFGSFVSAKAIPQLKDTKEVFSQLDLSITKTKLLAIVANVRGGEEASLLPGIEYVGFPLSLSETFQKRNTNKSIPEALNSLNDLMEICSSSNKKLVVYLSMGFGNPYGDPYSPEMVVQFSEILKSIGVEIISIADTVGNASSEDVTKLLNMILPSFKSQGIEFGVHLHSNPQSARDKIKSAIDAGCTRFDGALLGFGGCPMAEDKLVGNIDTQVIIDTLSESGYSDLINKDELAKAKILAAEIFT